MSGRYQPRGLDGRERAGAGLAVALEWEATAAPAVELGERPVWDAGTGCVMWVDIEAGHVHRCSPQGGDTVITRTGVPVGAAVPRAGGGYLLATSDGFRLTDAAGTITGLAVRPAGMPASVQFNDGACDPAGRFWAGTRATDGQTGTGALYRLDPDGSVTEVFGGVTESNGLAWSPDGTTFYYTDSGEPRSRIRAFDFDLASGQLSAERELISFGPADGLADGLVVDAEGCLWIAMWDGGCLRRYSAGGDLIALYLLPVSEPTCPGFGGPELDELYVTSAWQELDAQGRAAEPLAGRLLRARPGVRGLPVTCYAG